MSTNTFKTGDRVLITSLKQSVTKRKWLSPPLRETPATSTHESISNPNPNGYPPNTPLIHLNFGKIAHSDILNSVPSSQIYHLITPAKGLSAKYRISHPTLEDYINLTERKAQPIYSGDANAIVGLMDIHIALPEFEWTDSQPKLKKGELKQYLEAGTGHGSLSLAIAKQLQPGNMLHKIYHQRADDEQPLEDLRGAVLHSIDCNQSHSSQGKETLQNFQRGIYAQNVEFHLSDSPSEWIKSEEAHDWSVKSITSDSANGSAWLDGVFLDMPAYHNHMVDLCKQLKLDGKIVTFCPSISQIMDGVKAIDEANLVESLFTSEGQLPCKMIHERTIQLLPGMGGGLQEWDTRLAKIKATGEEAYVVRPKVGVRTVAGGFLSVWKKVGTSERVFETFKKEKMLKEEKPEEEQQIDASANIENVEEQVVSELETPEKSNTEPVTETEEQPKNAATTPKFKSYTFEPSLTNKEVKVQFSESPAEKVSTEQAPATPENIAGAPVSDFMKAFLSEQPLPAPETSSIPVEEQTDETEFAEAESDEYELDITKKIEPARIFPMEALKTVYKNCSGEVHVGYVDKVNVFDLGKMPEYAFEGKIQPSGPEKEENTHKKN